MADIDESAGAPAIAETHISTVTFIGDRAFKLLKPVENDFLDFSTPAARARAIDAELDLNRRLAPDVYLGTADVVERGELADRFLVMRRLPHRRRLSSLLTGPSDDAATDRERRESLRSTARTIAAFHAGQPALPDESDIAGRDAVQNNWADNVATMTPLVGTVFDPVVFDRVANRAFDYLAHSQRLFEQRLADGRVRDVHGDLTAQDIFCLPDGPRILDCLAFDRRLRVGDVLGDIAFLAMDVDRLAGPALSASLMNDYAEFSNEHHPASLGRHYMAYRAHVRAKVAGLRHEQGDNRAADDARSHLALADGYLEAARRRLIIVGGSPGTGKTTVSHAIADSLGWSVLSSDSLRKDLARMPHDARAFTAPGKGIYGDRMSAATYRELLRRAERLLEMGESVVLDASFGRASDREAARHLSARAGAELLEIECVVDAETAKQRIALRLAEGRDASDARPEILDELRAAHEPWERATQLATDGAKDDIARTAVSLVTFGPDRSGRPDGRSNHEHTRTSRS